VPVRIASHERYIAVEDAGRYRDAVGVALPPGLAGVFLEPVPDALESLVGRYARTHGPFVAEAVVERFGIPIGAVHAALAQLEAAGRVVVGDIRPGGTAPEWCDPEVLRRLKRRSLALLRNQIAPVEPEVYARFLARWHGVGAGREGLARLREVVIQLEGLPVLASALEGSVLPARIASFDPELLDALGAMGEVVWVGRGAQGPRDGRIALYRRDRIGALIDPPEPPDGLLDDPVRRAVYDHLRQRGASFLVALHQAAGGALADVVQALWDLAWAGLITNDTFQPLRGLRARKRGAGGGGGRPRGQIASAGGRWSLVAELFGPPRAGVSPDVVATERAAALASALLERYGVVCGAAARAESLAGGFGAVYPVLRAMEEAGRVRRGWFVDGLDGAQFAAPGVVDRLRACRDAEAGGDGDADLVTALDAADPASPWGALLPWPARGGGGGQPRRIPGATVVSVGARPVLFVDKGERSWVVLIGADEPEVLIQALRGWLGGRGDRWRTLRLERVDGVPAVDSPLRSALLEAGFVAGGVALEYVRR
jgi:ATP-dependent Lhr-like helicase